MLEYQIINTRSGGEYSIIGCDLALGYVNDQGEFVGQLIVRNVWLKQNQNGKHFVSWPSAVRMRSGTPVKKDDGKLHYDNLMCLYGYDGAAGGNKWEVAESGWEFQERLVEDLLKEAGTKAKVEQGRGAAKGPASQGKGRPTTATKAVGASTPSRTPATRAGTRPARTAEPAVAHEDGDDDLPF